MTKSADLMQCAAQELCAAETAIRQARLMFSLMEEDLVATGKDTFLLAQAGMALMDLAAERAGAACDSFSGGKCHG
ncbi:hypothetical protein [Pandoraea sputorum]|uniref:hypothetical protein n=1 Tax=Pandoraea sputorum TaxID=93222 RepID=UPI001242A9C1|nr:hypothetical protein [Pandoraea sputorum]VVE49704.1 hypothetical protein PSP20601_04598 [Pandoraea sputorum]